MTKKMFFVVDIDDQYQVLVFKVKETHTGEWLFDFYLTNGSEFEYQFRLLCNDVKVSELESLVKLNFDNGNMYIPASWTVE